MRFSAHAVSTISAASADDACFALGFVHGRDRLWSMEIQRRVGSGRLSEIVGEAGIARDSFMRRLCSPRATAKMSPTGAGGEAHPAGLDHAVVSRLPLLGPLLALRPPVGGGDHTVARAASRRWPETMFFADHGSVLRAIHDLGEPDASRFMVATGQSGDPISPHYDDLVEPWREGLHLTLPPSDAPEASAGGSRNKSARTAVSL